MIPSVLIGTIAVAAAWETMALATRAGAAMIVQGCGGDAAIEAETVRHAVWADVPRAARLRAGLAIAIAIAGALLLYLAATRHPLVVMHGASIVVLIGGLGALHGAVGRLYARGPIQGYGADMGAITTALSTAGAVEAWSDGAPAGKATPEEVIRLHETLVKRIMSHDNVLDVASAQTRLKNLVGRGLRGVLPYLRLHKASDDAALLVAVARKHGDMGGLVKAALERLGPVRCLTPKTPSGGVVCYDLLGPAEAFVTTAATASLVVLAAGLAVPFHSGYGCATKCIGERALVLVVMLTVALLIGLAAILKLVRMV